MGSHRERLQREVEREEATTFKSEKEDRVKEAEKKLTEIQEKKTGYR